MCSTARIIEGECRGDSTMSTTKVCRPEQGVEPVHGKCWRCVVR